MSGREGERKKGRRNGGWLPTEERPPFPPLSLSSSLSLLRDTHLPRLAAPLLPGLVWRGERLDPDGAPRLYLTLDDGPDPETTPRLLDLLAAHDARATFFLVGERVRRHPDLVRAARAAGHAVGQHTDTHVDAWRTPRRRVKAEMARATRALEDATGEAVRQMRPPYGRITPAVGRWARAQGQSVVMWDLMPSDFVASVEPATVAGRTRRLARPGSVVVLHEGGRAGRVALAALHIALPRLRAAGFRLDRPL